MASRGETRSLSTATFADGVDALGQQGVKMEKPEDRETMERELKDWFPSCTKVYIVNNLYRII